VVVRQEIECHRGNLVQQFIERRRVGGGGDIVAMPAPDRCLLIPGCRNRENDGFGHLRSVTCRDTPQGLRAQIDDITYLVRRPAPRQRRSGQGAMSCSQGLPLPVSAPGPAQKHHLFPPQPDSRTNRHRPARLFRAFAAAGDGADAVRKPRLIVFGESAVGDTIPFVELQRRIAEDAATAV
jgi:hypothetical protein